MLLASWLGCARDGGVAIREPTSTETVGTTASTPNCHGVVDVGEAPAETAPSLWVDLTLAEVGSGHVVCTAEDDPEDRVLARTTTLGDHHRVLVAGLRADTRWTCDAYADCGGPRRRFVHQPYPAPDVPTFWIEGSPDAISGAFTLFNTQRGCFTGAPGSVVVVDPLGRVRWTYSVGSGYVCDIDATFVPPDVVHLGGGWGTMDTSQPNRGTFRTVDLGGEVRVRRDRPDFGLGFNHHSQPLPDGSTLSLTGSDDTVDGQTFHGVGVERWHPDDGVVWTWSSQVLFDRGELEPPPSGDDAPYHANAARLVDDARGSGLYLSLYGAREIWRVDRDTGGLVWQFGEHGDFRLRDPSGAALRDDEYPSVQHDPEYGADGSLLVYDNGQDRGRSRVAHYTLDEDALEATLDWTYTEPGWFDPICGDVDWLDGGRVLITKAHSSDWSPGAAEVSEVVELEPPDRVIWRLRWPDPGWMTFRAQRLDGCAIFRSAKYCPEVAAEIDDLHPPE